MSNRRKKFSVVCRAIASGVTGAVWVVATIVLAFVRLRGIGVLVFLAILAHKVPNSFSLSTILISEGFSRGRAVAMNAAFALMVPVGAGLYVVLRDLVHAERFTSLALAASAGTFLHLALSDILPDLHRRGVHKLRVSGALLAGVAVMWALRFVHDHR